MAVAYETGVAASPIALLNKLDTFAGLHGWSIGVPTGSTGLIFYNGASDVGVYAAVSADATSWITRGCMGYNDQKPWNQQPGDSGLAHVMNLNAGPFIAYHFFVGTESGRDYIHVIVEIETGIFRHWSLGELITHGSMVGGIYSDSTFLYDFDSYRNQPDSTNHQHICDTSVNGGTGQVWANHDGLTNRWERVNATYFGAPFGQATGSSRNNGFLSVFTYIGHQRWNLRTPMWPLTYFINRPGDLRTPIGRIPNMRYISMTNYFPGELVTFGSEEWQVFPVFQKQTAAVGNSVVSSGVYGYAYLRP